MKKIEFAERKKINLENAHKINVRKKPNYKIRKVFQFSAQSILCAGIIGGLSYGVYSATQSSPFYNLNNENVKNVDELFKKNAEAEIIKSDSTNTITATQGPIKFISNYSQLFDNKKNEKLKDLMSWFYHDVSWGPEILTLSSINLIGGIQSDSSGVTLGYHTTSRSGSTIYLSPDVIIHKNFFQTELQAVSKALIDKYDLNKLFPDLGLTYRNLLSLKSESNKQTIISKLIFDYLINHKTSRSPANRIFQLPSLAMMNVRDGNKKDENGNQKYKPIPMETYLGDEKNIVKEIDGYYSNKLLAPTLYKKLFKNDHIKTKMWKVLHDPLISTILSQIDFSSLSNSRGVPWALKENNQIHDRSLSLKAVTGNSAQTKSVINKILKNNYFYVTDDLNVKRKAIEKAVFFVLNIKSMGFDKKADYSKYREYIKAQIKLLNWSDMNFAKVLDLTQIQTLKFTKNITSTLNNKIIKINKSLDIKERLTQEELKKPFSKEIKKAILIKLSEKIKLQNELSREYYKKINNGNEAEIKDIVKEYNILVKYINKLDNLLTLVSIKSVSSKMINRANMKIETLKLAFKNFGKWMQNKHHYGEGNGKNRVSGIPMYKNKDSAYDVITRRAMQDMSYVISHEYGHHTTMYYAQDISGYSKIKDQNDARLSTRPSSYSKNDSSLVSKKSYEMFKNAFGSKVFSKMLDRASSGDTKKDLPYLFSNEETFSKENKIGTILKHFSERGIDSFAAQFNYSSFGEDVLVSGSRPGGIDSFNTRIIKSLGDIDLSKDKKLERDDFNVKWDKDFVFNMIEYIASIKAMYSTIDEETLKKMAKEEIRKNVQKIIEKFWRRNLVGYNNYKFFDLLSGDGQTNFNDVRDQVKLYDSTKNLLFMFSKHLFTDVYVKNNTSKKVLKFIKDSLNYKINIETETTLKTGRGGELVEWLFNKFIKPTIQDWSGSKKILESKNSFKSKLYSNKDSYELNKAYENAKELYGKKQHISQSLIGEEFSKIAGKNSRQLIEGLFKDIDDKEIPFSKKMYIANSLFMDVFGEIRHFEILNDKGQIGLRTNAQYFEKAYDVFLRKLQENGIENNLFNKIKSHADAIKNIIFGDKDGDGKVINKHFMHIKSANDKSVGVIEYIYPDDPTKNSLVKGSTPPLAFTGYTTSYAESLTRVVNQLLYSFDGDAVTFYDNEWTHDDNLRFKTLGTNLFDSKTKLINDRGKKMKDMLIKYFRVDRDLSGIERNRTNSMFVFHGWMDKKSKHKWLIFKDKNNKIVAKVKISTKVDNFHYYSKFLDPKSRTSLSNDRVSWVSDWMVIGEFSNAKLSQGEYGVYFDDSTSGDGSRLSSIKKVNKFLNNNGNASYAAKIEGQRTKDGFKIKVNKFHA